MPAAAFRSTSRDAAARANIVDVARAMIARGIEPADLTYALELTMTSASVREHGLQRPLMRALLEAGAVLGAGPIEMAAAHGEHDALQAALEAGHPLDASIAAALGDGAALEPLLASASPADPERLRTRRHQRASRLRDDRARRGSRRERVLAGPRPQHGAPPGRGHG